MEISTATPTEHQEWDAFVHSHPQASPYHLYAWGQAIAKAYGHKPIYLIARQDDQVVGVLPLVQLKLPVLLNELVALPFCDVGSCLAANRQAEDRLLVEAVKCREQTKAKALQLRGPLRDAAAGSVSFSPVESGKVRMLLALPDSSEELLASFKSKLRSQVNKAEKNGVAFRWTGGDGVDLFYGVFCQNMHELGSPAHSRAFFQAIMQNYGDHARIGLAEVEGLCIGAGLILSTDTKTSIPWASTLRQYNRLAPNMLLYWNCLKYAADNKKNVFDFGRSTENEGTYRFKKQWGASPVPLVWYHFHAEPAQPLVGAGKPGKKELAAALWMKLPLPLANILGPKLRRYINL